MTYNGGITVCVWCAEPVLRGEQNRSFDQEPMHEECGFRSVVDSVGHILGRCECFHMSPPLNDPPRLSKREAARASLTLFRQIETWFGDAKP